MERFLDLDAASQFAASKMKKNNLFTTERMFCDVYCFEPGQTQAAHAHEGSDKVYVVLEGAGEIQVGDDTRAVSAGAAVLAAAGEPHGVANTGDARMRVLVFMAPPP